jgi:hypothetical protein
VSGSGVFLYNAGSTYDGTTDSGKFGGITLSGNGSFNLSAPSSGNDAGILLAQPLENTRALAFSGNAMLGMGGVIYAPSALLTMSGNAQLQNPLVVGMLNLSGNAGLAQTAAGYSTQDSPLILGQLLAGNPMVYVDNSSRLFTADELARIQDAINGWDALLVPYSVTITEVSDPALANLVLRAGTTSASGGAASGVLGCYDTATSTITIIEGWNWYAGSGPSQIGPGQYDFQTMVTHELGHALGLGHSTDPGSPMFATLATGMTHRIMTTQDLSIPDPPAGADPLIASGFQKVLLPAAPLAVSISVPVASTPPTVAVVLPATTVAPSSVVIPGASGASSPALAIVVPGTLASPARPAQPLIDGMSVDARAFLLGMGNSEDELPRMDRFSGPSDVLWEGGPPLVETAPLAARSVLRAWDEAIPACVAEDHGLAWPSAAVAMSAAPMVELPHPSSEQTLMAGLAVALWGTWEMRCRKEERRVLQPPRG